ncbi:glycoside hydrolase family 2 [Brachybacterium sp. MASK1Z-5]|uniref:Glycoside hydrolase family 2 n=1 Tax=Brachybacterium halotolerans TaxID=2795215 RepID=A0ABS1B7C8_9MICO|nr:sugar-binding domain-containing protein [Brachybacterium halotolerans]MBK0330558.1 glycoside hydrolase family 2 [Brachybacterium halotolerans]
MTARATAGTTLRATAQDGTHPRPTLIRESWTSLDGTWAFAHDDEDRGLAEHWFTGGTAGAGGSTDAGGAAGADGSAGASADRPDPLDRQIRVPFVPESEASGIGDRGFHPVVWYRRTARVSPPVGHRALLHLGAVDHEAMVWVNGRLAGQHAGGQTAFTVDLTDHLADDGTAVIVVRAADDPHDVDLPHGKQDWEEKPHGIWYDRTTGIWRSVWIEIVPDQHVTAFTAETDLARCRVEVVVDLARRPRPGTRVRVELSSTTDRGTEQLGAIELDAVEPRVAGAVEISALRNTQARDRLLWRPGHPHLVDARILVLASDDDGADAGAGVVRDEAFGYLGLRTVGVDRGWFLLNGEPCYMRSVLEQGFWPDTHLTPPSADACREEVGLILDLGFNAARIHQKTEDPRLLFQADRQGLMIWGETANAYTYSPRAVAALSSEWAEIVAQYRAHPSIVTWVPINESWGVRDLADHPGQRQLALAMTALTRALDPSRPVVSNDGYEHTGGDLLTVHDYCTDPPRLRAHYADAAALERTITGMGPQGRRPVLDGASELGPDAPVMLTEFGGIAFAVAETWGYAVVGSEEEFTERVGGLFEAVTASPVLAGFCYTQLTDTQQEANGLATADRRPKLDAAVIRGFVTGEAGA